jgi:hypothetical protein
VYSVKSTNELPLSLVYFIKSTNEPRIILEHSCQALLRGFAVAIADARDRNGQMDFGPCGGSSGDSAGPLGRGRCLRAGRPDGADAPMRTAATPLPNPRWPQD